MSYRALVYLSLFLSKISLKQRYDQTSGKNQKLLLGLGVGRQ